MKKKITSMVCGLAAASVIAFAFTACGDDSSSVSPVNQESGVDTPASSGSDTPASSGNNAPASSEAKQDPPASSDTPTSSSDAPASSGTVPASSSGTAPESSSAVEPASSSDIVSSSSAQEYCIDAAQICPPCNRTLDGPSCPVTNEPCIQCSTEGETAKECSTGETYQCHESSWVLSDSICEHITDHDGMTANGNCIDRENEIVPDCVTGKAFRCAANYWVEIDICPPGSKCNRDTISGTPCDRNGETLVTEDDVYQCNNGVWLYLPPPMGEKIVEEATNVKSSYRGGPAVAPSVVKVKNADGTVSIQDDGVLVNEVCTFNGLRATLSGDTLYATILYPGCTTTGGFMGTITFTLSDKFVNAKYIKYDDNKNVHEIREVEELNDCGNNASCTPCGEGLTC